MNLLYQTLLFFVTLVQTKNHVLSLVKLNGCPPNMIDLEGQCFKKISNCQIYKSENECFKCNKISQLTDGKCYINTPNSSPQIFQNLKAQATIPKGASLSTKLNIVDQANFNLIKNLIVQKYPLFVNAPFQPFVTNLMKSSYEKYFLFNWTNTKNRTLLFEFGISYDGTITEYISDDWDLNLQNSTFWKIVTKLTQKYPQKLMESTLTRIEPISKNLFKFHYYSDFGFHYMAYLQKIPVLEIKPLETLAQKYDNQQRLNYIYSQHPFLVAETSWNIQRIDNSKTIQYQIKFKSESRVILEQLPGQRQQIIFFQRQENQTLSSLVTSSKIIGGFQVLKDKSDQNVKKVLEHLFRQFKILKNMEIIKVEYQIVAGVIYLIHFKDNSINDEYMSKVFYSLSGQINILEIYLNSILIHSQPLAPLQIENYNFQQDPLFEEVQRFMKSRKDLMLPQKILYVNKILKSNELSKFYLFEIVYESNSFIIASYFIEGPRKGEIDLNNFINNGDNQLDEKDKTQLRNNLKDFLQNYRKWLNPLVVDYLKETKPNEYLLKILTEYGSYYVKVVDTEVTGFEIFYYELIDEKENCLTHSVDEIDNFLLTEKPFLTGLLNSYSAKIDHNSQLVSLAEGIHKSKIKYRLLFVNPANNKKVAVYAQKQDSGLEVNSVSDQNYGLYDIINNTFFAQAVQKAALSFPDNLKKSRPIFGMMNSTKVIIYFLKQSEQKESVVMASFDIGLQKGTTQILIEQDVSKSCTKLDEEGNCQECEKGRVGLLSECYDQIKYCKRQLGAFCLSCEKDYSLVKNTCINDCRELI